MPLNKLLKLQKLSKTTKVAETTAQAARQLKVKKYTPPEALTDHLNATMKDTNVTASVMWSNTRNPKDGYRVNITYKDGNTGNIDIPGNWDQATTENFLAEIAQNPGIITLQPQSVAQDVMKEAMLPRSASLYRSVNDEDLAMFRAKEAHTGLEARLLKNMDVMDTTKLRDREPFRKWLGKDAYFKNHEGEPLIFWRGSAMDTGEEVVRAATGPRELGVHLGPKNVASEFSLPQQFVKELNKKGFTSEEIAKMSDARISKLYEKIVPDPKVREKLLEKGHFMTPYVVNAKKPIYIQDLGIWHPQALVEELSRMKPEWKGKLDKINTDFLAERQRLFDMMDDPDELMDASDVVQIKYNKKIQQLLKSQGYDSVMYENRAEGADDLSIIVFDPTHMKSVFNRGTWDAKEASHFRAVVGVPVAGEVAREAGEQKGPEVEQTKTKEQSPQKEEQNVPENKLMKLDPGVYQDEAGQLFEVGSNGSIKEYTG